MGVAQQNTPILVHCGQFAKSNVGHVPYWEGKLTDRHVHWESIKIIKETVGIPVIYNGSIYSLQDANEAVKKTKCDGVMAARGLLANPGT